MGVTAWRCPACDSLIRLPGPLCCWPHCCNRLMVPSIVCEGYLLTLVLTC